MKITTLYTQNFGKIKIAEDIEEKFYTEAHKRTGFSKEEIQHDVSKLIKLTRKLNNMDVNINSNGDFMVRRAHSTLLVSHNLHPNTFESFLEVLKSFPSKRLSAFVKKYSRRV